jgi:hypothetical protein
MIKYFAFVTIIALRIVYQPGNVKATNPPFTSHPASFGTPAKLLAVSGSINNNKVFLNWVVSENETADQFEIEKSADGKNFMRAGLVFGTDKAETGNYQFFEKAVKKKMLYRVKLINKNKETEYSTVVEINPAA